MMRKNHHLPKAAFVLSLLLIFLCAFSLTALAKSSSPIIYVDGKELRVDTEAAVVSGVTLVPMRAIFEAIGAEVQWDQSSSTVIGTKDGNTVRVQIGSPKGEKNGTEIQLLQPAQLIKNRTMVPLRFISESLDCEVIWDGAARTVNIYTGGPIYIGTDAGNDPAPAAVRSNSGSQSNWTGHYYATKSGEKYHYLNPCGSGTYFEISKEDIARRRLEPCEKCVH